jgi:acyl phosphate:glycerol-3-phosphate acyltransferase
MPRQNDDRLSKIALLFGWGILLLGILTTLAFMLIGYFIGTIPTGYLVAKARGIDIQKMGSGNIGATNVLRSVGLGPAMLVLLLDPLKGFLTTLFPMLLLQDTWTIALTGLATVLGNNFNIFLKLRGGKGIATSMGAFLAVDPIATLLSLVIGVTTIYLGRYVSLGSMIGLLAAPLMLLSRGNFVPAYFYLAVALSVLAFVRHKENIKRLAQGVERRLGEKTKPDPIEENP